MRKLLVAVAAFCALVFAQGALAANTASISVSHAPMVLAGSKSTTIDVTIPQSTDPIAAIQIFVPSGYTLNTSQAAGTTIGTVTATAFSHDAGLTLPLSGNVTADNPASHASDSTLCAGTPTSQAVWIMNLSVAGQTIALPVYVNPTAGASQALGAYVLSICLPPPDVPVGTPGRSAQGAQVTEAQFTVNGIFTTPTGGGLLHWDALFTPYNPGKGTVNAAGTFEARALVPLPVILGLHPTYVKKTKSFLLTGKVTQGGLPVPNLTVKVTRGTSPSKLSTKSSAKTTSSGSWKATGRIAKTTYFRISGTAAAQDYTAQGCQSPDPATVAPGGCVSATLAPWSAQSAVLKLVVPKAKPAKKK